jgi:two-component system, NarL family, nitrate/nitrite response regulator NarL
MRRRCACATVLVGQCSLLREGLTHILCAAESRFRIVASAASIYDLVLGPMEQHQPLLLIIESGSDPLAMANQIAAFKDHHPSGRVAVLADQYVFPRVLSAFRAGANAYFLKVVASNAFIKALELVMLGETILPPELLSYVRNRTYAVKDPVDVRGLEIHPDRPPPTDPFELPELSSREENILRCIGEGDPNKIIARKIGIAEGTVKVHVKAILRKIRVGNRTQAAIWLMNNPASARAENVAQLSLMTLPADHSEGAVATGVDAIGQVIPHPPPHDHRTEFSPSGQTSAGERSGPPGKPRSASEESRIPTANAARIVNAKRSMALGPDGAITASAGSSNWPAANLTKSCAGTASRSSVTTLSRAAANSALRRPSLTAPLR